jgi:hypothetical protein
MSTFNSLLDQAAAADHSSAPETLADTLRKHAKELTDEGMVVLVDGLRQQRERWNTGQRKGSRELVTAKKVKVSRSRTPPPIPAGLILTKKPVL